MSQFGSAVPVASASQAQSQNHQGQGEPPELAEYARGMGLMWDPSQGAYTASLGQALGAASGDGDDGVGQVQLPTMVPAPRTSGG